jgi:gas vesicle protein
MNNQLIIGAIIGTALTTSVALYVNDKLTKRLKEKTNELRKLTRQVFETELKAQEMKQQANNYADKYRTAMDSMDEAINQLKKCKAYTIDAEETIGALVRENKQLKEAEEKRKAYKAEWARNNRKEKK